MTMQRRDFLRAGLVAAGGMVAGVGATSSLKSGDTVDAAKAPATLTLTADGELVVSSALSGAGTRPTSDEVRRGVPGRRWVMVIDLAVCDGCGKCTKACAKSHFVPPDREFIRLFSMQDSSTAAPYWFPRPCFHCDNPPCCQTEPTEGYPEGHLFPGTQKQNVDDMVAKGRHNTSFAARTHCPQKHSYDEANTYMTSRGSRYCRACGAASARARRARQKEAVR